MRRRGRGAGEQIERVVNSMPSNTGIERRDRAVIAFAILTGARDGAIASLKLKHVDLADNVVYQDPREVNTKGSKAISTWFFPVNKIFRQIVADWVEYLRKEELWGLDDPLFPATKVAWDANRQFTVTGLDRKHWSTAEPIRKIFRAAFEQAGLPYFNPHSFRRTLVQLSFDLKLLPEELKAWSQNLGHEQVMTTLTSYGTVSSHRQAQIIRDLAKPRAREQSKAEEIADAVVRKLRDSE